MSILDFKSKLALAKQAQAAGTANPNLRDYVGQMMVVTGMKITQDIEIKSAGLILDKVTFHIADGTALDSFTMAATEKAADLIEVLGEGPYPMPLLMEVCTMETKRGDKEYAKLIDFYDPENKAAEMELDEFFAEDQPAEPQDPDTVEPPTEDTDQPTDEPEQDPPAPEPTEAELKSLARAAKLAAKTKA